MKQIKITKKYLERMVDEVTNAKKSEKNSKCYDLGCALLSGSLSDDIIIPNEVEEYANNIIDAYADNDYLADNYVSLIGEYYYNKIKS